MQFSVRKLTCMIFLSLEMRIFLFIFFWFCAYNKPVAANITSAGFSFLPAASQGGNSTNMKQDCHHLVRPWKSSHDERVALQLGFFKIRFKYLADSINVCFSSKGWSAPTFRSGTGCPHCQSLVVQERSHCDCGVDGCSVWPALCPLESSWIPGEYRINKSLLPVVFYSLNATWNGIFSIPS